MYYTDTRSLVDILGKLDPGALRKGSWDRYSARYNPQVVMGLFDEHLIQPALRNPDRARPQLDLRWTDRLAYYRLKLSMRLG